MRKVLIAIILIALAVVIASGQSGISSTVSRVGNHGWPPPTRMALKRCVIRVIDSLTLETVAEGRINDHLVVNLRWEPEFSRQYHIDNYGCNRVVITFSPQDFTIFPGQIRNIFIAACML